MCSVVWRIQFLYQAREDFDGATCLCELLPTSLHTTNWFLHEVKKRMPSGWCRKFGSQVFSRVASRAHYNKREWALFRRRRCLACLHLISQREILLIIRPVGLPPFKGCFVLFSTIRPAHIRHHRLFPTTGPPKYHACHTRVVMCNAPNNTPQPKPFKDEEDRAPTDPNGCGPLILHAKIRESRLRIRRAR